MKQALAMAVQAALWGTVCVAGTAWAQEEIQTQDAQTQEAGRSQAVKLDTVTVTATRREASMQTVPISVSAVSAEQLSSSNVREATDLQYLVPNLTFSTTESVASGGGYQIRGIGTQAYDSGLEQSVGMVVDGVVIGLPRDPGPTGFGDIDRVEVLRGPQGTLFGKNSSAGVIQVVTRDPKMDAFQGEGTLMLGERNEHIARAALNIPLGDSVAVRLAGFYTAQDGGIPYVLHDHAIGDRRNSGLRGKLLWWATDKLSVLFSAEHQDSFSRNGYTIESLGPTSYSTAALIYNNQFSGFATKPGHGVYKAYSDGDWTADVSTDAASLKLDYALGENTVTSITAWRRMQQTQYSDLDASPGNILDNSDGALNSHQFTQEVRLTSPSGGKVEYVAGAFYYDVNSAGWTSQYGDYYNWYYCGLGLSGCGSMPKVVFNSGRRDQTSHTRSAALFGEATWALSEKLKLITGARYTHDEVSGTLRVSALDFPTISLGSAVPYDGSVDGDGVSGRIGLQWEPAENLMAYVTYARGYKGPAIDGSTGVAKEVKPETVDSFEIGAKSTLLDGAMILNVTLYHSDFRDFQAQALDTSTNPVQFALTNAGRMLARGVEFELDWRLSRSLTAGLNGAYSDARYKEFYGSCYTYQPLSASPGKGLCYIDPATNTQVANYAGERLANAPRLTYGLNANYQRAISHGLKFDAAAIWSWRSDAYSVTGDDNSMTDAYGILNANMGVGREDGRWRVGLYARNLLDKRFYSVFPGGSLNPGGYFRYMSTDAFRTVGVTLSGKF